MDYRDHVFLVVAQNLSFSKAANELCISQPAVSKHMQELERKADIVLFERKGNRIELTKAGQVRFNYLSKIKQIYHELDYELSLLKETMKGKLRVGASSTIAQYVVPSLMASFLKQYSGITLDLKSGNSFDMEQKLLYDDIDIALVENHRSLSGISYVPFMDDEIVAITSCKSPFAKASKISIDDIRKMPIVVREKGSGTLEVIQKVFQENDLDYNALNIIMHLGSTEAIKNFVPNIDVVGFVSEKAVIKELRNEDLIKLEIEGLKINRSFRIARKQGAITGLTDIFYNFLLNRTSV
ncbi:MAG: LysR substrate-binding domain-containing protein [Hyphomicrobiales bacterium]